jgi:hypothetical protein
MPHIITHSCHRDGALHTHQPALTAMLGRELVGILGSHVTDKVVNKTLINSKQCSHILSEFSFDLERREGSVGE